ncbi:MAG: ABC transporter ATP-binding protein [Myxococcales bacterium]|nr:ABC transporter ATP-binding protein [Myxococcales bacterium]MCB9733247.1 ABC transporter ATP-binding protein [Deltaproteobacteria bacterium]
MLEVKDIHVYYDAIHALKGVSLEVREGEIVTLIGANGAGKTTTLRAIMGLNPPREGAVVYAGQDVAKLDTPGRVGAGLILCPEGRQIFANLTVHENLRIGAFLRRDVARIERDIDEVYGFFPRLRERDKQLGGTLSGGEQQMLAMGRAMLSSPKMLLLDEPSMGLAPLFVKQIFEMIETIRSRGTTILLVEQNAHAALKIADRAYVMETGVITLSGPAAELAANPEVRDAYLGV